MGSHINRFEGLSCKPDYIEYEQDVIFEFIWFTEKPLILNDKVCAVIANNFAALRMPTLVVAELLDRGILLGAFA